MRQRIRLSGYVINMTDIVIADKIESLKGYRLIIGFPDVGLVGSIAAEHLQSKLDMIEVGYIESEKFPPISVVEDGISFRPVSIHLSEQKKLVLIRSYINISARASYEISKTIVKWANSMKIKEIISFAGVVDEENGDDTPDIFVATNDIKLFDKKTIKKLLDTEEIYLWTGSVYGLIGRLLLDSEDYNITAISFIVETKSEYPDARAAAKMLEIICHYLRIKIDLTPLLKEAETIENQVKAVLDSASHMQEQIESHSAANLMYR